MRLKFFIVVLISPLLFTCLAIRDVTPREQAEVTAWSERFTASLEVADEADRPVLQNICRELGLFVAAVKSSETAARLAAVSDTPGFHAFVLREFGKTPYELGLDAMMFWESRALYAYPADKRDHLHRLTRHFDIGYFPGSRAAADIETIARLAERHLAEVLRFCDPRSERAERFTANRERLPGKKISLVVPPNARYWERFNATAQTSFGAGRSAPDAPAYVFVEIGIPYYNAAGTAVMVHEITHLVELMLKADFSTVEVCRTEDDFRRWLAGILGSLWPTDTPLGEGFAEYAAFRFSPVHRLLLASPEELLRQAIDRRPLPEDILLRSPVAWDRQTRFFQYAALHSFVRFLVERFGEEKFLRFYIGTPLDEARFTEEFGLSFRQAEDEWRAWLSLR